MKLIFAGTGSAFTMRNWQTNLILRYNDKNLLFDCGGDIRHSLKDINLSYKSIDAMYISHLHGDHAGGVENLAFCSYFDPTMDHKIKLYGNGELLRKGWNNSWKGGLESIQGQVMSLTDYFDVNMVRPNDCFEWEGITFNLVQSVHIMNGYAIVPSYGLMFIDPDSGLKVFLTGDIQFNPNQIMDFYKDADIIVQDCETLPFCSGVHANFTELMTLPADIKKKMILVHYQDNILSEDDDHIISDEWLNKIDANGFRVGIKSDSLIIK